MPHNITQPKKEKRNRKDHKHERRRQGKPTPFSAAAPRQPPAAQPVQATGDSRPKLTLAATRVRNPRHPLIRRWLLLPFQGGAAAASPLHGHRRSHPSQQLLDSL